MTEWYVKDLNKLIGVSVQMLHCYDRIGLRPSLKGLNNPHSKIFMKDRKHHR
jgi:hypothetical protein